MLADQLYSVVVIPRWIYDSVADNHLFDLVAKKHGLFGFHLRRHGSVTKSPCIHDAQLADQQYADGVVTKRKSTILSLTVTSRPCRPKKRTFVDAMETTTFSA